MRRRREGLSCCCEEQRCEQTAHLCVMSFATRAGGQRCSASCPLCSCIGSHAVYRCRRLIGAIYAVVRDAETKSACSNTLSE